MLVSVESLEGSVTASDDNENIVKRGGMVSSGVYVLCYRTPMSIQVLLNMGKWIVKSCQGGFSWMNRKCFFLSPGYVCLYYFILPRAVSGPWNCLFPVCREKQCAIFSLFHFTDTGSGNAKETILLVQVKVIWIFGSFIRAIRLVCHLTF